MYKELLKYGVAGGFAFLCDFSVLYVFTEFVGTYYLVSNALGYFAGLVVSYVLNAEWVFTHRRYKNRSLEFTLFVIIVFSGLALSQLLMASLVEMQEMYYLYAKVFASFFVALFNYIAKKFLLFSPAPVKEIA